MTKRLLIALSVCLLCASGCNIIYKQNVQQGNAIEQEDLEKLRIGMSMNQVAFLMGTPSIRDPFHHDRWDYVSSFSRRGGDPVMRKVTLVFADGALAEMIGVDDILTQGESAADTPVAMADETPAASEEAGPSAEPVAEAAATAGAPADDMADSDTAAPVSAPVITAIEAPDATAAEFEEQEIAPADAPERVAGSVEAAPAEAVAAIGEAANQAPAAPEPAPDTPPSSGGWIIQLGAFDSRENAQNLVNRLNAAGFESRIQVQDVPGLGERYLVRHDGMQTRGEAEATLERIDSELGVSGFLLPPS